MPVFGNLLFDAFAALGCLVSLVGVTAALLAWAFLASPSGRAVVARLAARAEPPVPLAPAPKLWAAPADLAPHHKEAR